MDQHRDWNVRCDEFQPGGVGQHCDGAAPQGLIDVAATVRRCAGQGREQISRLGGLTTQRHPGDRDLGMRDTPTPHRMHLFGQRPERLADGVQGRSFMALTQYRPTARRPSSQIACRVSGGPGSGDSGTFSRCSSQEVMSWNSGAAELPGAPSAARCGLSIMIATT